MNDLPGAARPSEPRDSGSDGSPEVPEPERRTGESTTDGSGERRFLIRKPRSSRRPDPDQAGQNGRTSSAREAGETGENREDDGFTERLTQQFAQQWAQARAERRPEPEPIRTGPTNFSRAEVPWGLDLAAAWSWRLLVISAAALGLLWLFGHFMVITLPLVIALLVTALGAPLVRGLTRVGLPQGMAALLVVLLGLGTLSLLFTFVGQQVVAGAYDLASQVVEGIGEIKRWLRDGPLNASDSQINHYLDQAQESIRKRSQDGEVVTQVTEFGTVLGHLAAGFFIVLFATYFFLAEGQRIWSWFVRLAPRAARERVDSSGRVAWVSLVQFVRATVLVALADALGVMLVAWLLGVPFIAAIGVLVFLGAFVPMIGATVAGSVAVLVALVDQGPMTALLMFLGVIAVQQIEGHVLQPFLMGRFVSVHPLGVIVAIALGVLLAGVAGALIAVPFAAAFNAVVLHLAAYSDPGDDPEEKLDDELGSPRRESGEELLEASENESEDRADQGRTR